MTYNSSMLATKSHGSQPIGRVPCTHQTEGCTCSTQGFHQTAVMWPEPKFFGYPNPPCTSSKLPSRLANNRSTVVHLSSGKRCQSLHESAACRTCGMAVAACSRGCLWERHRFSSLLHVMLLDKSTCTCWSTFAGETSERHVLYERERH